MKLVIQIELDLTVEDLEEIQKHKVTNEDIRRGLKDFFPVKNKENVKVTFKEVYGE